MTGLVNRLLFRLNGGDGGAQIEPGSVNACHEDAVLGSGWVETGGMDLLCSREAGIAYVGDAATYDDMWHWLPAWRWGDLNDFHADWGGNWLTSGFIGLLTSMWTSIISILFTISSFLWWTVRWTVQLVYSSSSLGSGLQGQMNEWFNFYHKAIGNAGLYVILGGIAIVMLAFALVRSRPSQGFKRFLAAMLPIAVVLAMGGALVTEAEVNAAAEEEAKAKGETLEPDDKRYKQIAGSPAWVFQQTNDLVNTLATPLLSLSQNLTDSTGLPSTLVTCDAYQAVLEQRYIDARRMANLESDVDKDGSWTSKGTARTAVPLFVSRLWMQAYLVSYGQVQFGDVTAARRASCLVADWRSKGVSPTEMLAVWVSTCDLPYVYRRGVTETTGLRDVNEMRLAGCQVLLRKPLVDQRGKLVPPAPAKTWKSDAATQQVDLYAEALFEPSGAADGSAGAKREVGTALNLWSACDYLDWSPAYDSTATSKVVANRDNGATVKAKLPMYPEQISMVNNNRDDMWAAYGALLPNGAITHGVSSYTTGLSYNGIDEDEAGKGWGSVNLDARFVGTKRRDNDRPPPTATGCMIWLTGEGITEGGKFNGGGFSKVSLGAGVARMGVGRVPLSEQQVTHGVLEDGDTTEDRLADLRDYLCGQDPDGTGTYDREEEKCRRLVNGQYTYFPVPDGEDEDDDRLDTLFLAPFYDNDSQQGNNSPGLSNTIVHRSFHNEQSAHLYPPAAVTGLYQAGSTDARLKADVGQGVVVKPDAKLAREGHHIINSIRGLTRAQSILFAAVSVLVAFFMAMSIVGMAAGAAISEVLLAIVVATLPLTMMLSAFPVRAAQELPKKVLKLALGAAAAHIVFSLMLAAVITVIDLIVYSVSAVAISGDLLHILLLAAAPLIAFKVVRGVVKSTFGVDVGSIGGAFRLTSGLAAAAMGKSADQMTLQRGTRWMGMRASSAMMMNRGWGRGMMGRGGGAGAQPAFAGAGGRGGGATPSGFTSARAGPRPAASGFLGLPGAGGSSAGVSSAAAAGVAGAAAAGAASGVRSTQPTADPDGIFSGDSGATAAAYTARAQEVPPVPSKGSKGAGKPPKAPLHRRVMNRPAAYAARLGLLAVPFTPLTLPGVAAGYLGLKVFKRVGAPMLLRTLGIPPTALRRNPNRTSDLAVAGQAIGRAGRRAGSWGKRGWEEIRDLKPQRPAPAPPGPRTADAWIAAGHKPEPEPSDPADRGWTAVPGGGYVWDGGTDGAGGTSAEV